MINLKSNVYSALNAITAISDRVYFFYPDDFTTLPCVSYYEITNKETAGADDDEYQSEIEFIVDVWSKSSSEISSIALEVNTAMQGLGFKRTASRDMSEQDTKIYHKNMKFSQMVCE